LSSRLRWAVRRTTIARWDDCTEAVAAAGLSLDPAAEIVLALAFIEERIEAFRVRVPDVDNGAGNRLAIKVSDDAMHDEHFPLLRPII
jgi:hypothetical protein